MSGFGAFGKIPALGDFFQLDPPPGFVGPWDRWLQEGLLASRAILAERWQNCFLSAPIWRFTLAADLAGPQAVQGVLMASVDRSGRQFPLTLVGSLRGATPPDVLAAHWAAEHSFSDLEAIALEALEDSMTQASLAERLRAIPVVEARRAPPVTKAASAMALRGKHDLAAALSARLAGGGYPRPSIWTAMLREGELLYVQDGLPSPSRMADLYDSDAALWQDALTEGALP